METAIDVYYLRLNPMSEDPTYIEVWTLDGGLDGRCGLLRQDGQQLVANSRLLMEVLDTINHQILSPGHYFQLVVEPALLIIRANISRVQFEDAVNEIRQNNPSYSTEIVNLMARLSLQFRKEELAPSAQQLVQSLDDEHQPEYRYRLLASFEFMPPAASMAEIKQFMAS